MSRRRSWTRSSATARLVLLYLGAVLVLLGAAASMSPTLSYRNYWGGLVFGPAAVLAGVVAILMATVLWRRINEKPGKLKGRAARKARQAQRYRSAIDDYSRPWT